MDRLRGAGGDSASTLCNFNSWLPRARLQRPHNEADREAADLSLWELARRSRVMGDVYFKYR